MTRSPTIFCELVCAMAGAVVVIVGSVISPVKNSSFNFMYVSPNRVSVERLMLIYVIAEFLVLI